MVADELEAAVWDALEGFMGEEQRNEAIAKIERAIAWREENQGATHPDLIWPLALQIGLVLWEHALPSARRAAAIGERRLRLQRAALREEPHELVRAIRRLATLYCYEDDPFNRERVRELRDEAATLESATGDGDGR